MRSRHGVTSLADLPPGMILDPTNKGVEPREGMGGFTAGRTVARAINEQAQTIEFVCSTNTIDRYGEIVEPSGFAASVEEFMARNPVFPFGHRYELTPDGQIPVCGHWDAMRVTENALIGTAWFDVETSLGAQAWHHYRRGNLSSVSIGFMARSWEMREVEVEGEGKQRVRVFTKADLLEVSAVLIPANPEARLRAAAWGGGISGGAGVGGDAEGAGLGGLQRAIERLSNDVHELRSALTAAGYDPAGGDDDAGEEAGWGVPPDDPYALALCGQGGDGPGDGADVGECELQELMRSALSAARGKK